MTKLKNILSQKSIFFFTIETNSSMLVLASTKYDKKDYIRNYQKFVNLIQ